MKDDTVTVLRRDWDALFTEIERRRAAMAEINRIARIPTPQGMRAYTHFQRDFDRIRELTATRDMEAGK